MGYELDVIIPDMRSAVDQVNHFIEAYRPFILKVVTETKNGYVDLRNDDEFSIGLMAFHEAIDRYKPEKGDFLSFARLVIQSRLKNHWARENKDNMIRLEDIRSADRAFQEASVLKEEIAAFEKVLESFCLSFEDLADASPKHIDTLTRAKEIGLTAAMQKDIVQDLYKKKRLPVTRVAEHCAVSVKTVKRSKKTITAVIIAATEGLDKILEWISG